MAAKLLDLARALHLDISTVSRALRNDPRVQEATRARVRDAAASMGYRPNQIAKRLAEGKTRTVWMVLPGLSSPIEREPAEHAAAAFFGAGYDMLVAQHRGDPAIYERLLNRLREGVADGALLLPASGPTQPMETALADFHFPMVFVDRHPENLSQTVDVVTTDNDQAAYELTCRVIAAGAMKVAVKFDSDNEPTRQRLNGALRALAEKGIPRVESGPGPEETGETWGLVTTCQSDLLAVREQHPDWPIVYGGVFDQWSGTSHPFRQIQVCIQDFKNMAEKAARILLDRIAGDNESPAGVKVVPCLGFQTISAYFFVQKQ